MNFPNFIAPITQMLEIMSALLGSLGSWLLLFMFHDQKSTAKVIVIVHFTTAATAKGSWVKSWQGQHDCY